MPQLFADDLSRAVCQRRVRSAGNAVWWLLLLLLSSHLGGGDCRAQGGSPPLRVMSFNLRYGTAGDGVHHWRHRAPHVVETIRGFDADLVGTQEALPFQIDHLREALPAYDAFGRSRHATNAEDEQCAVLYRRDRFEFVEGGHFWLSETPDTAGSVGWDAALPRITTWVRLRDRPSGQMVLWFNTHFDHRGQTARQQSARLLRRRMAAMRSPYMLLTGDFNDGPTSDTYQALTGGEEALADSYRRAHPEPAAGEGTFHGFTGRDGGTRIDFVFTAGPWSVLSAAIDRQSFAGRWASDHFAVTATLAYAQQSPPLPPTRREDHVDDYHGQQVADPYRWLEADVRESPAVADWVARQNEHTQAYLQAISAREAIRQRLTALWNYEKYSPPFKQGGRYFYFKNDGLQNQDILYTAAALDAEPQVLIDPNAWSEDGTVALEDAAVSDQGKYLAYGVADAGSDWQTWRVLEIATGRVLDDEVRWVKFSTAAWSLDEEGFFYSRYDAPEEGAAFQSLNLNQKVYYHRVGTPQSEDRLVYARPDEPEWGFGAEVTEDGNYLVLTVWKGTDDRYRIVYLDLTQPDAEPRDLIANFEHGYELAGSEGPVFYFKTNHSAPRGRLIAIDTRTPDPAAWTEIIPQAEETLEKVALVGGRFVAQYLQDARSEVKVFDRQGQLERSVAFTGIGTATGFAGRQDETETFYAFTSFATPPRIYRYDVASGESRLFRQADVAFDPDDYVVQQIFYHSQDGTRIPMFIAHRKQLPRDGNRPTLLYGYGGFNISLTPSFSVARLAWMELGGVFAVPNLRGGGEYGEAWHEAGKGQLKQNVFDDFQAAATWLIENNYTSPARLAIQGGSNGGLLVGACLTQRPELFGACLPAVGVMDMLRFHQFTAGRFWVDEYGSADDREMFPALLAYSPYHNIRPRTKYPATMVTTADTDDRVVPGHSFKFAAALQAAQAGDAPILIRIETRAGHGAGKPTSKRIEEVADSLAFLVQTFDMPVDIESAAPDSKSTPAGPE